MPTQYVTFTVEFSARVDATARRDRSDIVGVPDMLVYEVTDVSAVSMDGVDFLLASMPKDVAELVEEFAAEAALNKGEWHD